MDGAEHRISCGIDRVGHLILCSAADFGLDGAAAAAEAGGLDGAAAAAEAGGEREKRKWRLGGAGALESQQTQPFFSIELPQHRYLVLSLISIIPDSGNNNNVEPCYQRGGR